MIRGREGVPGDGMSRHSIGRASRNRLMRYGSRVAIRAGLVLLVVLATGGTAGSFLLLRVFGA